jgi:hypothetical protein
MRLLRRLLLTLTLLLVATAIWAGIYVQRRGFPKTWREMVEAEFAAKGYPVDIGRLTLGPFQGLVAEDVRFFQDAISRREVAFVDHVILDLDLTDVLDRELAINTLDVKDATLTLPVTPGRADTEYLRVDRFSARLIITENQIEVARAQAVIAGMDVSMKGTLFRPPQNMPAAEAGVTEANLEAQRAQLREIRRRLDRVQRVVEELNAFQFEPGQPPRLEIEFSGDLADLAHLRGQARINASQFKRGAYTVNGLSVVADLDGAGQRLIVKELHLNDGSGDLRLRGEWPMESREFRFQVESTADLPALVSAVRPNPRLGEVVFFSPPRLNAEGTLRLDDLMRGWWPRLPIEATGEVRCGRFGSRGAVFDGLEAQFAVEGSRTYVRNLRLDHKSGIMFANFMHDPALETDSFRFQSEMKLDPRIFSPFLRTEASKKFLAGWEFDPESTVYLAGIGVGASLDPTTWSSEGVIDLRKFRLNNVPFDRLESEFHSGRDGFRFPRFSVERPEGSLTAEELQHDWTAGIWEVRKLESRLDPREVIRAVAPGSAGLAQRYRFPQPPVVNLNGRIDPHAGPDGSGHDFELRFASGGQAEFDFMGQSVPMTNANGTVRATGDSWRVSDFTAELYGGKVAANYEGQTDAAYRAEISVESIESDALLQLYGDTERGGGGRWTGSAQFSGQSGDRKSVEGGGSLELRGGNAMAVPFLGAAVEPVRKALASEDPGVPSPRDLGAKADFKLSKGGIDLESLHIRAAEFDLDGKGRIDRLSTAISFEMKATSTDPGKTRPAIVTGGGTLTAPEWRAVFPAETNSAPSVESPKR